MNTILKDLHDHVAEGDLKGGFKDFFALLSDCKETNPDAKHDVKNLRTELLMLSGTLSDIEKKFDLHVISQNDYNISKNRVRLAFINILDDLEKYSEFSYFLDDLEEEQAWEKTTHENTISAYERYFKQFPKGKYIGETEKIINQLKDQIKQGAQAEKERRKILKQINHDHKVHPEVHPEPEVELSNVLDWWNTLGPAWQEAIKHEIGAIGTMNEKKIQRALALKIIEIPGNRKVKSLDPIRFLQNLKVLNISSTGIQSLAGAETLNNLEKLDISRTNIHDISPLFPLKKLQSFIHSGIAGESLAQLRQSCPNCQILYKP